MWLLVGLGNPGASYAHNRHNAGFIAVDAVADQYGFSPYAKKFSGLVAEGQITGEKVLALKPQTFMNRSGESVLAAAQFYKIPLDHIIVIHDELDLAFAKLRIKQGGGSGGHNGLKDIDSRVGADYHRIRIGIAHPGEGRDVSNYVLGNFSDKEETEMHILLKHLAEHIGLMLKGDAPGLMNKVTLLMNPPSPKTEKPIKKKDENNGI